MALQPNTYHNTNIRYIFQFAKFPTSQSLRIAQPRARLYRHIGHIVPRHTLINYDAPRYCGFGRLHRGCVLTMNCRCRLVA